MTKDHTIGVDSVESGRTATLKAAICAATARQCTARFGGNLRAIVLSGSLARDEATFTGTVGNWKLLGDADFYLVFQDGAALPPVLEIQAAASEVSRELAAKGLIASVGFGHLHASRLGRLPRYIATYELLSRGQVIFGDSEVLSRIPKFDADEIVREDAWRMLANRMIELLDVAVMDTSVGASPAAQYPTIKLFLDMATSYLVFAGRYRSSYREREGELRRLAREVDLREPAPFSLPAFYDLVSQCTRFKLGQAGPLEMPAISWRDALPFAQALWDWELRQLAGAAVTPSGTDPLEQWMRRQGIQERLRGWASVWRRTGWGERLRHGPRWARLVWRASPRYCTYGVAAELLFTLPDTDSELLKVEGDRWRRLLLGLPVSNREAAAPMGIARLVAQNYKRFLETTTA